MVPATCKSKSALAEVRRPESCDSLQDFFLHIKKEMPTTFCIKNKVTHVCDCMCACVWLCVTVCACMCVSVWHHIVYCRMNLRDHMLSLERINCKGPPDWATASSGAPAPTAAPPLSRTTQQMVATLASVDVSPSFLHMQKCEKIDIKENGRIYWI